MSYEDELTKRLRAARAYGDVAREDIADALEMSASTYDRIERGRREVRLVERPFLIDTVARLCGLPPWFFWTELEPDTPDPRATVAVSEGEPPLPLETVVDQVIARLDARSNGAPPPEESPTPPPAPAKRKAPRAPSASSKRPTRSTRGRKDR